VSLIEYELETHMVKCDKCNGIGVIEEKDDSCFCCSYWVPCSKCNGTLEVKEKIEFIDIELETKDE